MFRVSRNRPSDRTSAQNASWQFFETAPARTGSFTLVLANSRSMPNTTPGGKSSRGKLGTLCARVFFSGRGIIDALWNCSVMDAWIREVRVKGAHGIRELPRRTQVCSTIAQTSTCQFEELPLQDFRLYNCRTGQKQAVKAEKRNRNQRSKVQGSDGWTKTK